MLKYLVILLADNSISYCHYNNVSEPKMISVEILQKGIMFAMKNDLKIQYVLPKTNLPQKYYDLINSMFHDIIGPIEQSDVSDIVVVNGFKELQSYDDIIRPDIRYVLRTSVIDFFDNYNLIKDLFRKGVSANVVFTDAENFTDKMIKKYHEVLEDLGQSLMDLILSGHSVNTNLLTDRIALEEMNNCGAGDTTITLAPNGVFYPCPAFYYSKFPYSELGDVETGMTIRNKKLFSLECSPLCRRCDAFHCKRCVWLNKKLTCEVNVPSRQQCVMAHVERNASKDLLDALHKLDILVEKEIESINYLDPFDEYQSV